MKLSKPPTTSHPMPGYQHPLNMHMQVPQNPEQRKKFEIAGTEFIVDAKYDIIKQIGSGAYGVVVSAKDLTNDHRYAIKKVIDYCYSVGY